MSTKTQWLDASRLTELWSPRRALWVIVIGSILLRAGSAWFQGSEIKALPGVADQISYYELALRVADGHGFSFGEGWWPATPAGEPTAHWSFLYVLFLSAVLELTNGDPLAARLIQAILCGVLQPLFTWWIARRLFGVRVGLVSAALVALYFYFAFYGGALVTESFYIVALLWVIDCATRIGVSRNIATDPGRYWLWAQLGVALSVATLLRQVALLLAPVIFIWLLWPVVRQSYSLRDGLRACRPVLVRLAVSAGILVAAIMPWTIRNYKVFDQVVLLNTNAGFVLFWANHPVHGSTFMPILPGDGSEYGTLIPDELLGFNEAQLDRALLERGLSYVVQDPGRYLLLSLSPRARVLQILAVGFLQHFEQRGKGDVFWCLPLPFLLAGLFHRGKAAGRGATGQPRRMRRRFRGVILVMLLAGLYCLVHLLTWTLIRYRLPVDAMVMPFAAVAIVACLSPECPVR